MCPGPARPAAASCWRPTASSSGTTTWCGPRASARARWRWCAGCCSSPSSPSCSGWRGGPATAATSLQRKLSSLQITVSSVRCCSGQPGIFAAAGVGRGSGCVREWLLVLLYGLLTSSASFSCVSAIPLMPIGDLIVVCMSTPVFSVILDKLVLKRPLTLLSVTLCVLIGGHHQQLVQPHRHVGHHLQLH